MSAYCLFDNLEVVDAEKMEEYKRLERPVVEQYGGRYVVIGGPFERKEGAWQPAYPVMIEFPDLDQARRWYDSPEYGEARELREGTATLRMVAVEGL